MLATHFASAELANAPSLLIGGVTVSFYNSIGAVEASWRVLEREGHCGLFQSLHWCKTWERSPLHTRDISIHLILGRNAEGMPLFILPFQVRKAWGIRVLEFLTSPVTTYGDIVRGSWCETDAAHDWFALYLTRVIEEIRNIDVIMLKDIRRDSHHSRGLFSHLTNIRAPDISFAAALEPSVERMIELRRSPDSRKNIRYRDEKLRKAGQLEIQHLLEGAALETAIDELFVLQKKRLAENGASDPFGPNEIAFFKALLMQPDADGPRHILMRLVVDGTCVNTIYAAFQGRTCNNLMMSLAQTPLRKFSPGDFTLRQLFALACSSGITRMDFGVGDHDYKRQWADETIELDHVIRTKTLKGFATAGFYYCEQTLRRLFKENPTLRNFYFGFRRRVFGAR
jgi:CelD/BcsL family acetyltransferase involved in cellulose biosynthesis